jgi:hypothetical protein
LIVPAVNNEDLSVGGKYEKAIQNIESGNQEDLHYSSAVTISKSDANAIKDLIIENLKSINARIIESKEEEVFVFNFDFFKTNFKNYQSSFH